MVYAFFDVLKDKLLSSFDFVGFVAKDLKKQTRAPNITENGDKTKLKYGVNYDFHTLKGLLESGSRHHPRNFFLLFICKGGDDLTMFFKLQGHLLEVPLPGQKRLY